MVNKTVTKLKAENANIPVENSKTQEASSTDPVTSSAPAPQPVTCEKMVAGRLGTLWLRRRGSRQGQRWAQVRLEEEPGPEHERAPKNRPVRRT